MRTPDFDGETYSRPRDHARLTSELHRVLNVMLDGSWRSLAAIAEVTGAPEASISARLRDLRKPKFGGYIVERRHVGNGLWHYRVSRRPASAQMGAKPMVQAEGPKTVEPTRKRWPDWECPVDFTEPQNEPVPTLAGNFAWAYCGGCKKTTLFRARKNR